jgi:alpha-L-fucosidase
MDVNKESIFDTRPWENYGEGPSVDSVNPINAQGFNEGKLKLSAKDIRFNQKGNILYVTLLGVPTDDISIKSLGKTKGNIEIKSIEVLGSKEKLTWKQNAEALVIKKPEMVPNDIALVFKVINE